MRPGFTYGETVQRTRTARRRLLAYGAALGAILLANLTLGAFVLRGPAKTDLTVDFGAVALIETTGGTGTGFLISPDQALTAAHVVGDVGSAVQFVFKDGERVGGTVVASGWRELSAFQVDSQTVRDGATPHDWAVVRLERALDQRPVLWLSDGTTPSEGETVWAVGHPGGAERNLTRGVLSGYDALELRTDADLDPGYSGGPLISEAQKAVIGILVSVPQIGGSPAQSVRNAVPIEVVIQKAAAAGHPIQ